VPGPDSIRSIRRAGKRAGIIGQTCLQRTEEKVDGGSVTVSRELKYAKRRMKERESRTERVAYQLMNFSALAVNFVDTFPICCNDWVSFRVSTLTTSTIRALLSVFSNRSRLSGFSKKSGLE